MDIKTLLLTDILIYLFMGTALLFYRAKQKTYPGFGHWTIGTFCAAFGYIAIVSRGIVPEWLSILLVNTSFAAAALFRLDGTFRFIRGKRLPAAAHSILLLMASVCIYFYFVSDRIEVRNLVLGVILSVASWMIARELLVHSPKKNRALYRVLGGMYILFGAENLYRGVIWMIEPVHGLLDPGIFHMSHFLFVTIFEVGWAVGFLMMNNQRMEWELRDTQDQLLSNISQLERAISEIKTLSGLLPICASCKKIRDDKGYWNQIESYITAHSDAEFSHGICPECAKKLYGEEK